MSSIFTSDLKVLFYMFVPVLRAGLSTATSAHRPGCGWSLRNKFFKGRLSHRVVIFKKIYELQIR